MPVSAERETVTEQEVHEVLENCQFNFQHPEVVEEIADLLSYEPIRNALAELKGYHGPTCNHCIRVAGMARDIAKDYPYEESWLDSGSIAALLHDLGKEDVPLEFITRPGMLEPEEREKVHEHVRQTFNRLGDPSFASVPDITTIRKIAVQHHEWKVDPAHSYPRTGTPTAQTMHIDFENTQRQTDPEIEEITELSWILVVADVIEALTSEDRKYRAAREGSQTLTREQIEKIMYEQLLVPPEYIKRALERLKVAQPETAA